MEKGSSSRKVLAAVIALALLSVAGNAVVIWAVRQEQSSVAVIQETTADSSAAVPRVERKLADLEEIVMSIRENLGSTEAYDDTKILEQLAKMEGSIKESGPDLSGTEKRLAALEAAVASNGAELDLILLHLAEIKSLLEESKEQDDEDGEGVPVFARIPDLGDSACDEVRLTVMRGDTVWDLACHFENPPSAAFIQKILETNQIMDPRKLRVGQVLVIPNK
ncbi:MAG: LysM peptidoglycan-binding domain-containing protein [Firmicutes bacterium]|nr:LysM peptidoglycan-binding domain-containing protein [Bacillota bacterium]